MPKEPHHYMQKVTPYIALIRKNVFIFFSFFFFGGGGGWGVLKHIAVRGCTYSIMSNVTRIASYECDLSLAWESHDCTCEICGSVLRV